MQQGNLQHKGKEEATNSGSRKKKSMGNLESLQCINSEEGNTSGRKAPGGGHSTSERKFKTAGEHKRVVRWWHVISGDEEVLSLLDRNWENVEVQTSWQIEPCLIAPQKPEAASSSNVNVNGSPGSSSSTNELNTPTPEELDSRIPQSNSTPAPIPSPTTEVLASEQLHVASSLHMLTLCSSDKSAHGSIGEGQSDSTQTRSRGEPTCCAGCKL